MHDKIILKNLIKKILLNSNKSLLYKKMNKTNELNHDEIDVAIGIIIKPILLKYITLIKIFRATDIRDIKNGVFVSWLAKKKVEKTFISANAGKPKLKKNNAFAEFSTDSWLNDPYPNNAEIISSDPIIKAIAAGKLRNMLSSSALFWINNIFFFFFDERTLRAEVKQQYL